MRSITKARKEFNKELAQLQYKISSAEMMAGYVKDDLEFEATDREGILAQEEEDRKRLKKKLTKAAKVRRKLAAKWAADCANLAECLDVVVGHLEEAYANVKNLDL